jgi:predicted  nucleic acid-binding Zn-ribbon protein
LADFLCLACRRQAAECELLNEQQEQLQGVSLEAEQLRQQVQQLRQSTADLPALREELQELQTLLMTRQQLQQEAQDAEQIRQQVQQLQAARLDLPALRQELQQLQDAHEEAKAHIAKLKEKVGVARCCRESDEMVCMPKRAWLSNECSGWALQ